MKLHNGFIGSDHHNVILPFIGGDSEQQLINNSKKMPEDWYYNNVEITYNYNNYGHRCKNVEEIDQHNYILFIGCSHTMGVGLELEKTFPYLLSEKLGMDYYNLAVPATGIDVLEYNLLTWLFKMKNPKLIVVQWPDHSRFIEYDSIHDHVLERGSWNQEPNYTSFIVNAEDTGLFYARKALSARLIKTVSKKTPTIMCNFGSQQQYEIQNLCMRTLDKARDLSHAGIKSHANFVDMILYDIEVKGLLK